MNDWLLLKCPNCGNLFRVSLSQGKDSAECTMCRQSVHFEPSEIGGGVESGESGSLTEAGEQVGDGGKPVLEVELPTGEEAQVESEIDDETLARPENTPEKLVDVTPRTAKGSSVSIGPGVSGEVARILQKREEKFRKMDEASQPMSASDVSRTPRKKKRRVKGGGKSSRNEFGWETGRRRRHRSDRKTMLVVGGGVTVMIVLMVALLSRGEDEKPEANVDKQEIQQQEQMLTQQAATMKEFLGEGRNERDETPDWHKEFNNSPDRYMRDLRPTIEGFLKAESWEERLGFCTDAETVRPLMENYYKDREDGPLDYREVFSGGSVSLGKYFLTASVLMSDYTVRGFVMLRDEDGSWKVDWESFVGYSTMSMAEFRKQRPTEPQLFRLTISRPPTGYFNYEFTDEQRWDCYLLNGRDYEEMLFAYVKKFSESASDLNRIFAMHNEAAITVMIRFPENAPSANQVEVVEVIGEGWVPAIMKNSRADGRQSEMGESNK